MKPKYKFIFSLIIFISILFISGLIYIVGHYFSSYIICFIARLVCFLAFVAPGFIYFGDTNHEETFLNIYTLALIAFLVLNFVYSDTRYVGTNNNKQHIYKDCPTLANNGEIHELIEFEAFFYFCFKDCEVCKKRLEDNKLAEEKEKTVQTEIRKKKEKEKNIENQKQAKADRIAELKDEIAQDELKIDSLTTQIEIDKKRQGEDSDFKIILDLEKMQLIDLKAEIYKDNLILEDLQSEDGLIQIWPDNELGEEVKIQGSRSKVISPSRSGKMN